MRIMFYDTTEIIKNDAEKSLSFLHVLEVTDFCYCEEKELLMFSGMTEVGVTLYSCKLSKKDAENYAQKLLVKGFLSLTDKEVNYSEVVLDLERIDDYICECSRNQ